MIYLKYGIVALLMLLLVVTAGSFFLYVAPFAIVGSLAFVGGTAAALVAGVMIGRAHP